MAGWNPADATAGLIFSNSNFTVTTPSAVANYGVRAVLGHTSGKWYFEAPSINTDAEAYGLGVGLSTDALTSGGSLVRATQLGGISTNQGDFAGPGVDPTGHRLGFAIDLTDKVGFVRMDGGNWYGLSGAGADPTVPAQGVPFIFTTTALIQVRFQYLGSGSEPFTTINPGDTAFVDAIPTGYTAWDSTPPPNTKRSVIVRIQ